MGPAFPSVSHLTRLLIGSGRPMSTGGRYCRFHALVAPVRPYTKDNIAHFYHLKKPKPSAIITSRDAYSQSEITETSVSVLLNGVNAGYRIVLSRSNPTPKRIREME